MAKVEITHPEKIYYPKEKITKNEVIEYYKQVSSLILPHMKDRPCVMERYPEGINGVKFYQKNLPDYFPSWVHSVELDKKAGGKISMVTCNTKDELIYLANHGSISMHLWTSKKQKPKYPDRLVFDLDPSTKDLGILRESAQILKEILEEYGLSPNIMTSGQKGFHIHCKISPQYTFDEVRGCAKFLADLACEENTKLLTSSSKSARRGKIYIDYLRNSYGQHSIAPYSLRATPRATIAVPFSWKQLCKIKPDQFTLRSFRACKDPWHLKSGSLKKAIRDSEN